MNAFNPHPRESVLKLADRFDEVAMPLITMGLMTSRDLALTLRRHIPSYIKRATLGAMLREDERRFELGKPLVDKDEKMALAQKKEGFLLEFEEEMRAADQTPDPRPVDNGQLIPLLKVPRLHRPIGDRLGAPPKDMMERLGSKTVDTPMMDTREYHVCPNPPVVAPSNVKKSSDSRPDTLAAHKTTNQRCESCNKPGHTEVQC